MPLYPIYITTLYIFIFTACVVGVREPIFGDLPYQHADTIECQHADTFECQHADTIECQHADATIQLSVDLQLCVGLQLSVELQLTVDLTFE